MTIHANVHGIEVGYTFDGPDPLGGFFGPFEDGCDEGPPRTMSVDIRRVVRVSAHVDERWRPIFFYGRVQAYAGDDGLLLLNGEGVATVSNEGAIRIETSGSDELTEGLFHVAMMWALRARGLYDLHAAAVVPPGRRPMVLAGDSGVGKTTWMLAFIESGARYLGDDRVLLRRGLVYGYPRAFHLGPATLEAFRQYAGDGVPLRMDHDTRKQRIAPRFDRYDAGGSPPGVLLFPQIVDTETSSVRPLGEAEAFGRLLVASALVAVDGIPGRDEQLACLRDLVVRTPCYELIGGRDVLERPALVAQHIQHRLSQ